MASPVARRLAEEPGVDLKDAAGTALGGGITKKDVLSSVVQKGTTPSPTAPAAVQDSIDWLDLPPIRRITAGVVYGASFLAEIRRILQNPHLP